MINLLLVSLKNIRIYIIFAIFIGVNKIDGLFYYKKKMVYLVCYNLKITNIYIYTLIKIIIS